MPESITTIRRANVNMLFSAFAEQEVARGAEPVGLQIAFARRIEVHPSMWSQIKKSRPISDKLARQIEGHCGKPPGWLDEPRKSSGPSEAEAEYLELALAAYRATNADGRRQLRRQMKEIVTQAAAGRGEGEGA